MALPGAEPPHPGCRRRALASHPISAPAAWAALGHFSQHCSVEVPRPRGNLPGSSPRHGPAALTRALPVTLEGRTQPLGQLKNHPARSPQALHPSGSSSQPQARGRTAPQGLAAEPGGCRGGRGGSGARTAPNSPSLAIKGSDFIPRSAPAACPAALCSRSLVAAWPSFSAQHLPRLSQHGASPPLGLCSRAGGGRAARGGLWGAPRSPASLVGTARFGAAAAWLVVPRCAQHPAHGAARWGSLPSHPIPSHPNAWPGGAPPPASTPPRARCHPHASTSICSKAGGPRGPPTPQPLPSLSLCPPSLPELLPAAERRGREQQRHPQPERGSAPAELAEG